MKSELPASVDLNATFTYDNEGRMLTEQYPLGGPNLARAYDAMGRLNTLTEQTAQQTIISGATYGPAGQLLSISGLYGEGRGYNSLLQMTSL